MTLGVVVNWWLGVRERRHFLACWCAPEPCHGDPLLRLANAAGSQLPLIGFRSGIDLPPASPF
jgi:hypothetical protein